MEVLTTKTAEKCNNDEIDNLLRNTWQKLKIEAETKTLQVPLVDIGERIAYYTGISEVKLHQIQNELAKDVTAHSIDFNFYTPILIYLCNFYLCKLLPTYEDLFEKYQSTIAAVQNYEKFIKDLNLAGISYHTIYNKKQLLMEDPNLTFQRYSYLKRIRQIRPECALVYYVSAKLIDKDGNFNAPWHQKHTTETASDEYTFFHTISSIGFINGLFSFKATEDDFYKWVVDILLRSLSARSVVVLEYSPFNGISNSKPITIYDTKQDMQKWLANHNVPCSNAMNKSQLYELIKKHAVVEEITRVAHAIRADGHEVLILPPHYEELSPINFIWRDIRKSKLPFKKIHDKILDYFVKMPQENYQRFENYVKDRENELFTLQEDIDKALETLLLDL